MAKKVKNAVIVIRINNELKTEIKKIAEEDKRSLSDFIITQMEKLIDSIKKENQTDIK